MIWDTYLFFIRCFNRKLEIRLTVKPVLNFRASHRHNLPFVIAASSSWICGRLPGTQEQVIGRAKTLKILVSSIFMMNCSDEMLFRLTKLKEGSTRATQNCDGSVSTQEFRWFLKTLYNIMMEYSWSELSPVVFYLKPRVFRDFIPIISLQPSLT